jgi:hypothetical protein
MGSLEVLMKLKKFFMSEYKKLGPGCGFILKKRSK